MKVQVALAAIDAMEAQGLRPERVASDHWRHVGGRIAVAQTPSLYTRARHRAFGALALPPVSAARRDPRLARLATTRLKRPVRLAACRPSLRMRPAIEGGETLRAKAKLAREAKRNKAPL